MKKPKQAPQYTSLGITMASGMIFFSYAGYLIDQKRGGGQCMTLTGMFLGLFYCGYEIWKIIKAGDEK